MIWNRSLSSSEIEELYIKGKFKHRFTEYTNINETNTTATFTIDTTTKYILPDFRFTSGNATYNPFISPNLVNDILFLGWADLDPPDIIVSINNNSNHSTASIDLNTSSIAEDVSVWWYTNDSGVNNYSFNTIDVNLTGGTQPIWDEGHNFITVFINDTVGNENSTTVNFTVDAISPVISDILEKNLTTTSITINWSTDELANSSITYGLNLTDLGSNVTSSTSVLAHSLDLSSLIKNTRYFYNITSCGILQCRTNGTFNFTTLNVPPEGEASKGAKEASVITKAPSIKEKDLSLIIHEGSSSNFIFNNVIHRVKVNSIKQNQVELIIFSNPIYLILNKGESRNVDLDHDKRSDISITLMDIIDKNVEILIKEITKDKETPSIIIPSVPITEESKVEEPAQVKIIKEKASFLNKNKYIIILLISILIAAILIYLTIKKIKPKKISKKLIKISSKLENMLKGSLLFIITLILTFYLNSITPKYTFLYIIPLIFVLLLIIFYFYLIFIFLKGLFIRKQLKYLILAIISFIITLIIATIIPINTFLYIVLPSIMLILIVILISYKVD